MPGSCTLTHVKPTNHINLHRKACEQRRTSQEAHDTDLRLRLCTLVLPGRASRIDAYERPTPRMRLLNHRSNFNLVGTIEVSGGTLIENPQSLMSNSRAVRHFCILKADLRISSCANPRPEGSEHKRFHTAGGPVDFVNPCHVHQLDSEIHLRHERKNQLGLLPDIVSQYPHVSPMLLGSRQKKHRPNHLQEEDHITSRSNLVLGSHGL